MKIKANEEHILKGIEGKSMEIKAIIDPENSQMIELNILRSPKKEEYTSIQIFPRKGYQPGGRGYAKERGVPGNRTRQEKGTFISLLTSHSSILSGARSRSPETAEFVLKKDELINLRIFIDRSVIEVFANEKQIVAARVYPGLEKSDGVSIRSQGSECELISLDAWQMHDIWIDE